MLFDFHNAKLLLYFGICKLSALIIVNPFNFFLILQRYRRGAARPPLVHRLDNLYFDKACCDVSFGIVARQIG